MSETTPPKELSKKKGGDINSNRKGKQRTWGCVDFKGTKGNIRGEVHHENISCSIHEKGESSAARALNQKKTKGRKRKSKRQKFRRE